MEHLPARSVAARLVAAAVAVLAITTAAAAQTSSVGLSTVRAQRFGNENLLGFYTPQVFDQFAYALATGDFNGDGADDLATGIPRDDGLTSNPIADSGTVIVRYGSPGAGLATNLASTVLRQTPALNPPEDGDRYGYALSSCDFNGDGFDDLAIGIPYEDHVGQELAGAVQIHYGTSSGLAPAGDRFYAQSTPGMPGDAEPGDLLGETLACGDFDADGFDELVIGIPEEDFGEIYCAGMVDIVPGTAFGLDASAATYLSQDVDGIDGDPEYPDCFGAAAAVGDFNDDGFDDLAIGAIGEDFKGAIHVVFGGTSGLTAAGSLFWMETFLGGSSEDDDYFGGQLISADFDGDGFDDLAIAIPFEDLGPGELALDAGRVGVIYGAPDGFDRSRTQFWSEDAIWYSGTSEADDWFGFALAAGDFDQDGFADLAIGHPSEFVWGPADGAATVLMGSAAGLSNARVRGIAEGVEGFPGDMAQHAKRFAWSLASGDFDGDGHADLALGAPFEDENGIADVGAETVLYGALFADGVENGYTSLWSQTVSPFTLTSNKIFVKTAAKLGPPSSKYGFELKLVNPAGQFPGAAAYVRVGPEAGFKDERTLKGTFFVDPQSVTMSTAPGAGAFQMVDFRDGLGAGSKTRLSFDLDRNVGAGGWALQANYFDETLNAVRPLATAFFAPADSGPNFRNNRIDFEWTAGNPGHLTMWRTRFLNGVPDASGRVPMVSIDLPGSPGAVVNHVLVGMISGHDAGTFGSLFLDELSFRR